MTHNRIAMELLLTADPAPKPTEASRISVRDRATARLFAHRMDREIDRGAPVFAGTALASHAGRITSLDERIQLARSLRTALQLARNPERSLAVHVPVHRGATLANAELINEVTLRLHAALPVRPRGMARLRLLLADGGGPLYRPTRGSLTAQLRGILAAL